MKHLCWVPDYEDEDNAIEIEAMDAEGSAEDACERWEENGRWAGDPMPSRIYVRVRDDEGALFDVVVGVDYSIDFYSIRSAKVIER